MKIKPANENDVDAAWNIIESCADWLVHEKGLDHWKKYYTRDKVAEKIRTGTVYLVILRKKIIATVTITFTKISYYTDNDMLKFATPTAKAGYVSSLAVLPHLQRHGIATRLMTFAEKIVQDNAAHYLRIDCRSSYEELVAFYQKRGFKQVGLVEKYPAYVLMEKFI